MTDSSNILDTELNAAAGAVGKDAILSFLPVLNGFLTNIQGNPSQENLVAQGLLVEPALIAALPNFEASSVKDLAGQIQTLMNAQAALLQTTLAAPPAPAPTGVSAPATPTPVVAAT